eukprot:4238046-Pleurochrysis_carterae.AAC.6
MSGCFAGKGSEAPRESRVRSIQCRGKGNVEGASSKQVGAWNECAGAEASDATFALREETAMGAEATLASIGAALWSPMRDA